MKTTALFLFFFSLPLFCQDNTFENILGGQQEGIYNIYKNLRCLSADQDSDGNYVLLTNRGHVIKTNSHGDVHWVKYVAAFSSDNYAEIKDSPDNTYVVASGNKLLKLSYSGEILWEKSFGYYTINTFVINNSGDILTGVYLHTKDAYLASFSPSGDSLWGRSYSITPSFPPFVADIAVNDSTIYFSVLRKLFALELNGNIKWQKDFSLRIMDIALSPNNLYLSLGYGSNTAFEKMDLYGNSIWSKNLAGKKAEYIASHDKVVVLGNSSVHFISGEEVLTIPEPGLQSYNLKVLNDGLLFSGEKDGQLRFLKTDYNYYYKSLTFTYNHRFWNGYYMAGGDFEVFYKTTNLTSPITFEYSLDKGSTWQTISSTLQPDDTVYNFSVPVLFAENVLIRLSSSERISGVRTTAFSPGNNYDYINANNVLMWVGNNGDGSHDPNSDGSGLYWPDEIKTAVFQDGLVFGGKVNGEIRVNGNTHRQGLVPGAILNGLPDDKNKVKYAVWKLNNNWKNLPDGPEKERYQLIHNSWPVEFGAPFSDVDKDGVFTPGTDEPGIGDETLFYVANDSDTAAAVNTYGTNPIGLEFRTTTFAFNQDNQLKDVVFKKYNIINKGSNSIEDMYLSYWSDPDLGFQGDDYVGVDSASSLAYCYNSTNADEVYGSPPPAVGYRIIQGPIVKAESSDIAMFNGKWIKGYKNLPATAFIMYINMSSIPWRDPIMGVSEGAAEFYNYMQGLIWNGDQFINPVTLAPTKFILNGDPYYKIGWYEGEGWPGDSPPGGDRRFVISTGPFNMAPGDTQEIVIAVAAALGNSNTHSIKELVRTTNVAEHYYKSNFTEVISSVKDVNNPQNYSLSQNYPNPFNPSTLIKYQIPADGVVTLKVYNILGKEVAVLVNSEQKAGSYELNFNASKLASGVYIYQLKVNDFNVSKKMVLLK